MANVPGINVWNLCDADAEIAGYCVVADDDGYWTIEGDSDEIPEAVTTVLGLFGGWSNTNIVVGAEYNTMDVSFSNLDEDVPSDLTSIYANYIVRNNLTVFVRRDHFDPNDDIQHGDSVDTTIAGFIWAPTKGLAICPNITQVTQVGYEEDVFAVNFQFKF